MFWFFSSCVLLLTADFWVSRKLSCGMWCFFFFLRGLLFPHLAVGSPTLLSGVQLRFSHRHVNGFLIGAVNVKVQEGNGWWRGEWKYRWKLKEQGSCRFCVGSWDFWLTWSQRGINQGSKPSEEGTINMELPGRKSIDMVDGGGSAEGWWDREGCWIRGRWSRWSAVETPEDSS